MNIDTVLGVLIPFPGISAGAACVFFMKKELSRIVQMALTGFASGVMVAASIWSLIIPAMEQSESMRVMVGLHRSGRVPCNYRS